MSEPLARLARIDLYPIKSLDGVSVPSAVFDAAGALEHDRAYALFDEKDVFVNGKHDPRIHLIRARFSQDLGAVTLNAPDMPELSARLEGDETQLNRWFSRHFDRPVFLRRRTPGGFPDDTDRPGPTLVSRASLMTVGDWLRADADVALDPAELRGRFRTNLELGDCAAFAEDAWYGEELLIGEARLTAVSPCPRCVVPTRDTQTGEQLKRFTKVLTDRRRAELPRTADPARFDHFYRLAVNTSVPAAEAGKTIRVGDPVHTEFQFEFKP